MSRIEKFVGLLELTNMRSLVVNHAILGIFIRS